MNRARASKPLLSKVARNERRKLLASTINTLGLAVFGLGFVQTIFAGAVSSLALLKMALSSAVLYTCILIARRILAGLED